jgi:hypothetical protein
VVFDESIFPFSSTTTPPSTPDLDLFSLFPTDAVVEPPERIKMPKRGGVNWASLKINCKN